MGAPLKIQMGRAVPGCPPSIRHFNFNDALKTYMAMIVLIKLLTVPCKKSSEVGYGRELSMFLAFLMG